MIVVDDDGNDVPTFESGTVYMKMPGNAFEYKGDKEKTEKSRLRGFFTVGDIAISTTTASCSSMTEPTT